MVRVRPRRAALPRLVDPRAPPLPPRMSRSSSCPGFDGDADAAARVRRARSRRATRCVAVSYPNRAARLARRLSRPRHGRGPGRLETGAGGRIVLGAGGGALGRRSIRACARWCCAARSRATRWAMPPRSAPSLPGAGEAGTRAHGPARVQLSARSGAAALVGGLSRAPWARLRRRCGRRAPAPHRRRGRRATRCARSRSRWCVVHFDDGPGDRASRARPPRVGVPRTRASLRLAGPHFALATRPAECAAAIERALAALPAGRTDLPRLAQPAAPRAARSRSACASSRCSSARARARMPTPTRRCCPASSPTTTCAA